VEDRSSTALCRDLVAQLVAVEGVEGFLNFLERCQKKYGDEETRGEAAVTLTHFLFLHPIGNRAASPPHPPRWAFGTRKIYKCAWNTDPPRPSTVLHALSEVECDDVSERYLPDW